jgi:hypothetical protein
LNFSENQTAAQHLSAALPVVSDHVAQAALSGAATAQSLAALAQVQAERIDDSAPEQLIDAVKRVQMLTVAANHAAELGMNLMKANKELLGADEAPTPVAIAFGIEEATREARREGQGNGVD